MKIETLHIFPQDEDAYLTAYIRSNPRDMNNKPRRAILICPGGGYDHISNRESEPIALAFLARGYNVFVLNYSVREKAKNLVPLSEIRLALKHIKEQARLYNIRPDKVFALGFSAGGHLALSSGVLLPEEERPDGLILCYPVVTARCPTHLGSLYNFCGTKEPSDDDLRLFSLDLHVNNTTPPAFIWHTETDMSVPVQNSLNLDKALSEHGVPHELHLFPYGEHGLSLATHETCAHIAENEIHPASVWVDLADAWIKKL